MKNKKRTQDNLLRYMRFDRVGQMYLALPYPTPISGCKDTQDFPIVK